MDVRGKVKVQIGVSWTAPQAVQLEARGCMIRNIRTQCSSEQFLQDTVAELGLQPRTDPCETYTFTALNHRMLIISLDF